MRYFTCFLVLICMAACTAAAELNLRGIEVLIPAKLSEVKLSGPDSSWQIVVTGQTNDGQQVDVTSQASFSADPQNILEVDSQGLVTPQSDGPAVVTIRVGKHEARLAFAGRDIQQPRKLNFVTDVAPLFTRLGCNSGGCHGKTGGQDGFELALLGFEPHLDYDRLVKDSAGSRIDLKQPDDSYLLLKATNSDSHTGGELFKKDSAPYRLLRRWIAQGAPREGDSNAVVERIEVLPREQVLSEGQAQRLLVLAHLDDGTIRDVTRLSVFETNQAEVVTADKEGQATAGERAGVAAIMVRYQTHVGVFRAVVPTGNSAGKLPTANNFVDELVFAQLERLGIPASADCDDATFIRRVTIDIAGRLPTIAERDEFVASTDGKKHERLVDRLLASDDYADYFAGKWAALLHNRRNDAKDPRDATDAFYAWIRDGLRENQPYDQFVRGVLTAAGQEGNSPPVVWYRAANEPSQQVEDVAQLFLGQRIQCARCHHHPLEKWSEQDYCGMTSFFSRLEVIEPKLDKKKKSQPPVTISFKPGRAEMKHPKTGEAVRPTPLGESPLTINDKSDPREALTDWMTQPDNDYFARALVNRYWKHFLGRGLVEPEDDMRATNPPTNPALLDALAEHFVKSKFDLREIIRVICNSRSYRLSALAREGNLADHQSYSHFQPRRLHAEVFLDAIDLVTATKTKFAGVSDKVRAVQLPDNQSGSYFLEAFGRPAGMSVCECERATSATLTQQLYLLNSPDMLQKVQGQRAQQLASDKRPPEERLRELYLLALAREPSEQELAALLEHLKSRESETQAAYADIVWAIINTKEFQFNH